MRKIVFLAILLCGCGPIDATPTPAPQPVTKIIVEKFHEAYTENEIDGWHFIAEGQFRQIPVMKNRYRLYAEDGMFVEVDPSTYARTRVNTKFSSLKWRR